MHLLITNQHGENRGDEAAMNAMLGALRRRYPGARFTLLYQYRDRGYRPPVATDVRCLPILMRPHEAMALALAACLFAVGLRGASPPLGTTAKAIWRAYRDCDMVISAPGGPYFGDLYANHEWVHAFLIWLGRLHRKPIYLFASSCGPFEIRWLNPFRRRMFSWFRAIRVREEVSAGYLQGLIGRRPAVTADSAFLAPLSPPQERSRLVTVTALRHRAWSTGGTEGAIKQASYERALLDTLSALAALGDFEFVFLPQLCGNVHSDTGYLTQLGQRLPSRVRWRVLDRAADADDQRRLIGSASLSIATRYHHQVFSIAACTPCIAICYEHKSTGLMRSAGMSDLALAIDEVSGAELLRMAQHAMRETSSIQNALAFARVRLRRRALQTVRMIGQ